MNTITGALVGLMLVLSSGPPCPAQDTDPLHPEWDRYRSSNEAHSLLRAWSRAFPRLTKLHTIGETLQGTPLMVLEITNQETGPASEKPGYYYDGNIHAEELAGAEVALYFAWHVLTHFGEDAAITKLLDTRVLFVRPKFNPDGADVALETVHNPRSTPRPYDEDGDGMSDEDPPDDLDGDGFITRMRVPNPNGVWRSGPGDSRLMVRKSRGDATEDGTSYDVYSEGVDEDGDGAFNEDDVGGIDMNRNFPRNWGLEFEQTGAGPYPLSEPETRATIELFQSHRNITGVLHGHTSGGFLFRLPSTTSWDAFPVADQRLIVELSRAFEATTGQPVRPSYTNPRLHRHGTLISWAYWDFGVVGSVPEYWGGFGKDYDADGSVSDPERLRWNDEELGGEGFASWAPYDHPQLGTVEIGGWRRRFTARNPPPRFLRDECALYVPWMVWLAQQSPLLEIRELDVARLDAEDTFRVTLVVHNVGYLPTNITQRALDSRVAVPVRARLELVGSELLSGSKRLDLGHIKGSRDTAGPRGRHESRRSLEWVVRRTGPRAELRVVVVSEKGGTVRREVELR